jgi:hypothetical protein
METDREADVMKAFYALCSTASEAEDTELDRYLEPEYSSVLDHIIAHPEYRKQFGTEMLKMADFPGDISAQLVEYCMHELRWPEVEAAARVKLAAAEDPRSRSVFEHILESFQDGWDDEGYERWTASR